jgi:ribonuclease HII
MADQLAIQWGCTSAIVAGVDEAGRGPLAGPVVSAAVILDDRVALPGLRDSKKLTARQRQRLAREIRLHARAFAVAMASAEEIDALNILEASLRAMARAVAKLSILPTHVRVDGDRIPPLEGLERTVVAEAIVRGDALVPAISAASILAKTCRDGLMCRWHRRYPQYGFDQHKGYPTARHLEALAAHGPCPLHRRTFGPVRAAAQAGLRDGFAP